MRPLVREAYETELRVAQRLEATGDLSAAFHHLERAHILGQRRTLAHLRVHWSMLRLGWRLSDRHEVLGQLSRIVAAALFSCIWVPQGNTGGARVSAFVPMSIPEDLRRLIDDVS